MLSNLAKVQFLDLWPHSWAYFFALVFWTQATKRKTSSYFSFLRILFPGSLFFAFALWSFSPLVLWSFSPLVFNSTFFYLCFSLVFHSKEWYLFVYPLSLWFHWLPGKLWSSSLKTEIHWNNENQRIQWYIHWIKNGKVLTWKIKFKKIGDPGLLVCLFKAIARPW